MTPEEHINDLKRVIALQEKEISKAHSEIRGLVNMLEEHQQIFIEIMRDKYNEL